MKKQRVRAYPTFHCPIKEQRWDLYKNGLSASLIQLWLACRQQFNLAVVKGWTNRSEPIGPAFGSCIHWVLRQAYAKHKIKDVLRLGQLKRWVIQYGQLWLKEHPLPTTHQREQQEMIYTLADAILPEYVQYWKPDWTGKLAGRPHYRGLPIPKKWLSLEKPFDIPWKIPGTKHTIRLRGVWDGICLDQKDRLWVFDTKCFSVIVDSQLIHTLPHDFQFWLYLTAAWIVFGQCPYGIILNVVRRPQHHQGKHETLKDFGKRVAGEIAKDPDHSFIRYVLEVTSKEIKDWHKQQLDPVLRDFWLWWEGRTPHYMTPFALINKYGQCSMFEPITQGNFSGCYQKEKGHLLDYQTAQT